MRAIGIATTCVLACLFAGFVVLTIYATIRAPNAHEILAAPGAADCRRTPRAMNVEISAHRKYAFIVKRELNLGIVNCTFYWHEAHSGGN
jgi:hypothetical protein